MTRCAAWWAVACSVLLTASSARSATYTIDFETDDDFLTPLVHGQAIYSTARANHINPSVPFSTDTVLEFGRLIKISSSDLGSDGNLGPAIFDSDPADNPSTTDPDLLVGLGNLLMLQRDEGPNTILDPLHGLKFRNPSDEGTGDDQGSIVIDFLAPNVHPVSIDLVDVDSGVTVNVILTDDAGKQRTYIAPSHWTTDVTKALHGYKTLSLETLLNQSAEPNAAGGPAVALQDAGFNGLNVKRLEIEFIGPTPSGAIDNLVFTAGQIPEPSGCMLAGLALMAMAMSRKR